jgi:purine-cytosine permease-like protein
MGAFTGSFWTMLVGAVAAAEFPKAEVATALQAAGDAVYPGFGPILLGVALVGLMTIAGLNYDGASLTLLSVVDSLRPIRPSAGKRIASLALVGIVASGIAFGATGDFVKRFGDLLAVLLYLFTPWTAVNLVDFYLVRKSCYSIREIFNSDGIYGRWNWRGLVAYGGGFAAMIPFFSTGLYTGPVARALGGADIAMLVGLPVSGLIYLLSCRSLDLPAERRRVREADLGLDPADPAGHVIPVAVPADAGCVPA